VENEKLDQEESRGGKMNTSFKMQFLDRPIIRKGLYYSLPVQFITILIPYITWKVHMGSTLSDSFGDALFIYLLAIFSSLAVGIVVGSIYYFKKELVDKIKPLAFIILSAGINVTGLIYTIYTWVNGLNFTFGFGGSLNVESIFPYTILIINFCFSAVEIVMVFISIKVNPNELHGVLYWALIFTAIALSSGLISKILTFIPGILSMSLVTTSILFGLSGFLLKKTDLDKIQIIKKGTGKQLLVKDTVAVDLKGFCIAGYLFLAGQVIFHYVQPLFRYDIIIIHNSGYLLSIPIATALLTATCLSRFGIRIYKERLYLAATLNLLSAVINYSMNLVNLSLATVQSIIIGCSIGLMLEPIFSSLLKVQYQRNGFTNTSTLVVLSVLMCGLLSVLSGMFTIYRNYIDAFYKLGAWILFLFPIMPFVFFLNYSIEKPKKGKLNWPTWILIAVLVVGFILSIIITLILELAASNVA